MIEDINTTENKKLWQEAALAGNIEEVLKWINQGIQPNHFIRYAAQANQAKLVDTLLAHQASRNIAIFGAGMGGHRNLLKKLMGQSPSHEILTYAARGAAYGGQLDLTLEYIKQGVTFKPCLQTAAKGAQFSIVLKLIFQGGAMDDAVTGFKVGKRPDVYHTLKPLSSNVDFIVQLSNFADRLADDLAIIKFLHQVHRTERKTCAIPLSKLPQCTLSQTQLLLTVNILRGMKLFGFDERAALDWFNLKKENDNDYALHWFLKVDDISKHQNEIYYVELVKNLFPNLKFGEVVKLQEAAKFVILKKPILLTLIQSHLPKQILPTLQQAIPAIKKTTDVETLLPLATQHQTLFKKQCKKKQQNKFTKKYNTLIGSEEKQTDSKKQSTKCKLFKKLIPKKFKCRGGENTPAKRLTK